MGNSFWVEWLIWTRGELDGFNNFTGTIDDEGECGGGRFEVGGNGARIGAGAGKGLQRVRIRQELKVAFRGRKMFGPKSFRAVVCSSSRESAICGGMGHFGEHFHCQFGAMTASLGNAKTSRPTTPDRHLLGRCEGETTFKAFLGASTDLIKNIHGVAPVAELDGDEVGYLVAKVVEIKRQR